MINNAVVITEGGAVLWHKSQTTFDPTPINKLIKEILIPQQSSLISSFRHSIYNLEWLRDNELGILFVIVYLNLSKFSQIKDLLTNFKKSFCASYQKQIKQLIESPQNLNRTPSFDFTNQFIEIEKKFKKQNLKEKPKKSSGIKIESEQSDEKTNLKSENSQKTIKKAEKKTKKTKKVKPNRVWTDLGKKMSSREKLALDFSETPSKTPLQTNYKIEVPSAKARLDSSDDEIPLNDIDSKEAETLGTKISSLFSRVSLKTLTQENLKKPLEGVEQMLIDKNVSSEISRLVCKAVSDGLVGKSIGKLTFIDNVVREQLRKALLQIIAPENSVHIMRGISESRELGKPFSIVFVGVNGVGKSTTLSKIAYFLQKKNLRVSLAACDTFRSGAVEQLLTHAKALKMRVFHKGYSKDASQVCSEAIKKAEEVKDDVILIDTAGRMQNNEPLLKSLQRLVRNNNPNIVLFVGEALVGNEAMNQLERFGEFVKIDGIVLTKMDTVDDKVGAAISMTYKTRLPVIFMGIGQTHQALAKVDPTKLVNLLLK